MAIKIPFVAEVSSLLAGTADVVKSLLGVSDALDDVGNTAVDVSGIEELGRSADAAGLKVTGLGEELDTLNRVDTSGTESELKEIGSQADATGEKIERSFSEAFDKVRTEGKTASTRVKADLKDTGDSGSATMREFSQEAKQNVSETVSSFNGSASSAVDAIQGTFGGLVSALGPAGLVGAAVAGVGIGLARGLFEKSKEAAQEVAEEVANLTGQLIELGSLSLGTEAVNDKLKEFATTAEDGTVKLNDLKAAAEAAGISSATYARGVAGDNDALKASWDEVTGKLGELDKSEQDLLNTRGVSEEQIIALVSSHRDEKEALGKTREELLKTDATLDQSADTAKFYNEAVDAGTDANKDAKAAIEAKTQALKDEARQTRDVLGTEIAYEAAIDAATEAAKKNGKTLDLNTEKGRNNATSLKNMADTAIAFATAEANGNTKGKTFNKTLQAQAGDLVKAAEKMGLSHEKAEDYAESLLGIPVDIKTKAELKADKAAVRKAKQDIDGATKDRTTSVKVKPDMSEFDASVVRYLAGKKYYVTAVARAGKNVPV